MASRNGGISTEFKLDMAPLITGVVKLDDRLDRAVAGVMKQRSHIIVGWMKQNAPWTDRTGNARSGLSTETEHVPKKYHRIWMFYRVGYGIWLEIRFAGKYSIIVPTIEDQAPKLMKTFDKLFSRLQRGNPTS